MATKKSRKAVIDGGKLQIIEQIDEELTACEKRLALKEAEVKTLKKSRDELSQSLRERIQEQATIFDNESWRSEGVIALRKGDGITTETLAILAPEVPTIGDLCNHLESGKGFLDLPGIDAENAAAFETEFAKYHEERATGWVAPKERS